MAKHTARLRTKGHWLVLDAKLPGVREGCSHAHFEPFDVQVDLDFGCAGGWVKLGDIDTANDIAPNGTNSLHASSTWWARDGRFGGFTMASSSGFIYKWEAPA